jgi:hypothetical protein
VTLRLEVIGFDELRWSGIADHWNTLLRARPDASVFLSEPWIRTWLDFFGPSLRPDLLLWRSAEGQTSGACLVSVTREAIGPFRLVKAYVNATGEKRMFSEHNMLLCVPGAEPEIARHLVDHLRRRRVEVLSLDGMRDMDARAIQAAWQGARIGDRQVSDDRFVALDALRAKTAPYLASLSRNTREKVTRSTKIYREQLGAPELEVAGGAPRTLAWFAELRELHTQAWRSRGQPGAFAQPDVVPFLEQLIRLSDGDQPRDLEVWTDVLRVRFGETVVGLLFNLRFRRTVSFYQSAFRYDTDNRLKPGLVTHAFAIQHYLDNGQAEYDFLAGEPTTSQYKVSLASGSRPLYWIELNRITPKTKLVATLRSLKRTLRRGLSRPK